MDFIIGGVAGAGATIFSNPLDMIKTRMQLQGELATRSEEVIKYRNTLHAVAVIARTDGILALQQGLTPALVLGFIMNGIRLGTYRTVEVKGWTSRAPGVLDMRKAVFWAALSGGIAAAIANPFSVIKIRFQTAEPHENIAVGKQYNYKSVPDALVKIYKTEGFRGYYVGVAATSARLAVGSGAQLASFAKAKQTLLNHGICKTSPFGLAFLASCISGAAVALAACPIDVVTVRLYNQGTTGELLYNGVADCFYKIWKTEGLIHGFYKGLFPLYLRMAPHTTVALVIWDVLHHNFRI